MAFWKKETATPPAAKITVNTKVSVSDLNLPLILLDIAQDKTSATGEVKSPVSAGERKSEASFIREV